MLDMSKGSIDTVKWYYCVRHNKKYYEFGRAIQDLVNQYEAEAGHPITRQKQKEDDLHYGMLLQMGTGEKLYETDHIIWYKMDFRKKTITLYWEYLKNDHTTSEPVVLISGSLKPYEVNDGKLFEDNKTGNEYRRYLSFLGLGEYA